MCTTRSSLVLLVVVFQCSYMSVIIINPNSAPSFYDLLATVDKFVFT